MPLPLAIKIAVGHSKLSLALGLPRNDQNFKKLDHGVHVGKTKVLCLLVVFYVGSAFAGPADIAGDSGDEGKALELETMEVIGTIDRPPASHPEISLQGEKLRMQIANTLGKTLEQQMGVNNASFGPGVGVPVIRGLTGSRIRILQDGIGSNDASSVSPDHAVTIEPLLADSITVLKGPAVVRYGSSAIGGAVNVSDGRIPDAAPENLLEGAAELRYGSNGDEKAGVFKLNAGKDFFALHLDGFYRERDDLTIPGSAIDTQALAKERNLSTIRIPNTQGVVGNTDLRTQGGSIGGSISNNHGLLGMSANTLENQYGIPAGGHGLGHSHGLGKQIGGKVRVDMNQTRYDFKAEWAKPLSFVEAAKLRMGLVDYQHAELDAGVRSTRFKNEVLEGRFELPMQPTEHLTTTLGLHWSDRSFSAIGTETFAPATQIDMLAGFFTGRAEFGNLAMELGLRKEQQDTTPALRSVSVSGIPTPILLPEQVDHSPHSVSSSLDWKILPKLNAHAGYGWYERAPDVQELLSTGPHLATSTFDVGNVGLNTESSRNLDLGLSWQGDWLEAKIHGFYNEVSNYIYQGRLASDDGQPLLYASESHGSGRLTFKCAETGSRYCLPVYGYSQADAILMGYEVESVFSLPETRWGTAKITLFSDYVRGRFDDQALGNVPRLPPLRYGAELGWETINFSSSLRLSRSEAQHKTGNFETETRGFFMLNLNLNYHWDIGQNRSLLFFLRGDNLLDQEARNAVSFLRNVSPEAGRSFELGVRASF